MKNDTPFYSVDHGSNPGSDMPERNLLAAVIHTALDDIALRRKIKIKLPMEKIPLKDSNGAFVLDKKKKRTFLKDSNGEFVLVQGVVKSTNLTYRIKDNTREIREAFDFLLDWMHRPGSIYKAAFDIDKSSIAEAIYLTIRKTFEMASKPARSSTRTRDHLDNRKIYWVPPEWRSTIFSKVRKKI